MKKDNWIPIVFIITFILSFIFGSISTLASNMNVLLLGILLIGIILIAAVLIFTLPVEYTSGLNGTPYVITGPLLMLMTIVSIATTLPELIVSIIAVLSGNYSISIGNAVGSVTANTGLILAIGIIFMNGTIERKEFGIKAILIILASLIIFIFGLSGSFGILPSMLLLIIFLYDVYETIVSSKRSLKKEDKNINKYKNETKRKTITVNVIKFIAGMIGIIFGANLLVENAKTLAIAIGVSDGIIAITIVAVGTSLPELITTITAIIKKQSDLGIGNIIGANIIDLVLILPICSIISKGKLIIEPQSMYLDVPVLLIISLLTILPTMINKRFTKIQGVTLLIMYIIYLVLATTLFL